LNFKNEVAKLLFWIFTARKILAINFKQHLNFLKTEGWWPEICVGHDRIGEIGKVNFCSTMSTTRNTKIVKAPPEKVYEAFVRPEALETWQAPGDMKAKVIRFDLREGGSYEMVLSYPETDQEARGKSGAKEDRYTARFVTLQPGKRIVEAIRFDSSDVRFQGEMIMEVTFEAVDLNTLVTMVFRDVPAGISPEDNEKGTELSLQKLARYVEGAEKE